MGRFGLIGYPISHSCSPELFRAVYGDAHSYDLIETPDFDTAWERFLSGYDAVNVTAPFKTEAARRARVVSEAVARIGAANILVKGSDGIAAHNSDYLGLLGLIPDGYETLSVIGLGGAGRAAVEAARDRGLEVKGYHHDEIAGGVESDIIIYTLPGPVPGSDKVRCSVLIESNYRNPCMTGRHGYISGKDWLLAQARTGFPLMTGESSENFGEFLRSF